MPVLLPVRSAYVIDWWAFTLVPRLLRLLLYCLSLAVELTDSIVCLCAIGREDSIAMYKKLVGFVPQVRSNPSVKRSSVVCVCFWLAIRHGWRFPDDSSSELLLLFVQSPRRARWDECVSCTVLQEDIMLRQMTVENILTHAALSRLPTSMMGDPWFTLQSLGSSVVHWRIDLIQELGPLCALPFHGLLWSECCVLRLL
jgi:hypothetical protein